MIFFFSGTGNSRFVANRLADRLCEQASFIPETDPEKCSFSGSTLGFVFPVYSWGIPPLIEEFIARLSEEFCKDVQKSGTYVWMACTCGDEAAFTPEMLSKALSARNIPLKGIWSVIMPNNYVLLPGFNVDNKEVEKSKLEAAPARIDAIAEAIARKETCIDIVRGKHASFKSKMVYPLFKRWGIFPRRWRWTPECIGCEQCAVTCPMGNIRMQNGHPLWGDRCVSCLMLPHLPYPRSGLRKCHTHQRTVYLPLEEMISSHCGNASWRNCTGTRFRQSASRRQCRRATKWQPRSK